jgi:release factor glutamine methyltransferase
MQMSEVWTPVKLIKWSEKYFADKKTDSPRLTSELLLAHVLKWQRVDLYTKFEYEISPEELKNYKELLLRRAKGEPLQYLIGETQFLDLKIKVSPRVLIPRPETEQVLIKFVELITGPGFFTGNQNPTPDFNIVDLGTGSGILALKLAQYFPEQTIYAVDINADSIAQAQENQKSLKIENIKWFQGNFLEALPESFFEKKTLIISNPPYLSKGEFDQIAAELKHEPSRALLAGPTGIEAYKIILEQIKVKCLPDSCAVFEIGDTQGEVLLKNFQNLYQM